MLERIKKSPRINGWLRRLQGQSIQVCNVCGGTSYAQFYIGGTGEAQVLDQKQVIPPRVRRNYGCIDCQVTDRERLFLLWFDQQKKQLFSGRLRLLHVAPEKHVRKWLQTLPDLDYVTVDLLQPDVDYNMDLTAMTFADDSFDAVICSHVLEHIPDDEKAMAEIRRVLKPDGWALLQVPISFISASTIEDPDIDDPDLQTERFGQYDHVRIYGRDYFDRLTRQGLTVSQYPTDTMFSAIEVDQHGLCAEEVLFVHFSTKQASLL
jgi:SAM-dependent methyltransferase